MNRIASILPAVWAGMTPIITFSPPNGDENCFECIRTGQKFCAQPDEVFSNVAIPTNNCIPNTDDCPDGTVTIYNEASNELAAITCPCLTTSCG